MIYIKDKIDMALVSCEYDLALGYIKIEDDYTNSVLQLAGYRGITDENYTHMCIHHIFQECLEQYALLSAENAYSYAYGFLKKAVCGW